MIALYVNTVKMPVYRGDAETGRHVVAVDWRGAVGRS